METQSPAPAGLIDLATVARLLGVSKSHARRLADAGRMPSGIRLGRIVRWSRSELTDWINQGCPDIRSAGQRGAP
jgi:excisionase family DNA binding protein